MSACICRFGAWFRICAILLAGLLSGSGAMAADAPVLTSPSTAAAIALQAFSFHVRATGDQPITYAATGLPAGLWLNPVTGRISGRPLAGGVQMVTVTATNPVGSTSAQVDLEVATAVPVDVVAWGDDSWQQSTVPAGLHGAVSIAAGRAHSLAVRSDGTVAAWGLDDQGQCQVPIGLDQVVAVAAGAEFSLALRADGTVVAWGRNDYGQRDVPAGLSGVSAIAAGERHALALKDDGQLVAWGDDEAGECSVPTGLPRVVCIAAGSLTSLALLEDGTVRAWGGNNFGQRDVPAALDRVVAIAVGYRHALAVQDDGLGVMWGTTAPYSVPTPLHATGTVAAGYDFSLAIRDDGRISAWGYDTYNACSGGAGLRGVVAVSGGEYHALALRSSAPQITAPLAQQAILGQPFTWQLTAEPPATTWSVAGLPAGLAFDAGSGIVSGIPSQIGPAYATVTVQGDGGSSTGMLRIMTVPPGACVETGRLSLQRYLHTASLLPQGRVLVAGGYASGGPTATCELFDPGSGAWSATASLNGIRTGHAATPLPDGRVLVTGGYSTSTPLDTCELYDPATGRWSAAAPMGQRRAYHTATLLSSGKVLVAGGSGQASILSTCEVFDPATGIWTQVASMHDVRLGHAATLLPSGAVLLTGGQQGAFDYTASTEMFDPAAGTWTVLDAMAEARSNHTATLLPGGNVLIAGGGLRDLTDCELFDPVTRQWSTTGRLAKPRSDHSAALLPNGLVLVSGGHADYPVPSELYDPSHGCWVPAPIPHAARAYHAATVLPSGRILITGGYGNYGGSALAAAELFDFGWSTWSSAPTWQTERWRHTATSLPSGRVLVIGGIATDLAAATATVESFESSTGWSAAAPMSHPRFGHTATLLPDGRILVAGGSQDATCEIFDPTTGLWTPTGPMSAARLDHTATLMNSGLVLVVGGVNASGYRDDCELYDPRTGAWVSGGVVGPARSMHTATLLPDGKVLVVGGTSDGSSAIADCRLYDPITGAWVAASSIASPRAAHRTCLLTDGRLLLAGGFLENGLYSMANAMVFDPRTGAWTATGAMQRGRSAFAMLAFGDRVLAIGGGGGDPVSACESYDPATGSWSPVADMAAERAWSTATRLPAGAVLVAGGSSLTPDPGCELFGASGQASYGAVTVDDAAVVDTGSETVLTLSGSGFAPRLTASTGGLQSSASNFPLVQITRVDSGQQAWLPWSADQVVADTAAVVVIPGDFPNGPATVQVFANGIASAYRTVLVENHVLLSLSGLDVGYDASGHAATVSSDPGLLAGTTLAVDYTRYSADPAAGGTVTGAPSNTAPALAGWYRVRAIATGAQHGIATGVLLIRKAVLTVHANDAARPFGAANPTFTGTMSGMVSGDGIDPVYSTTANPASALGHYPIHVTLSDPFGRLANYATSTPDGVLTVTAASVDIVLTPAAPYYDGLSHPMVPSVSPAGAGAVVTYRAWDGDPDEAGTGPRPGSVATSTAPVDAGWYLVHVVVGGNYAGTLDTSLHILQAPLSVRADDAHRPEGAANPVLTGQVTGAIASDGLTFTYSTTADAASSPGTYPITVSIDDPGLRLANYQVMMTSGELEVIGHEADASGDSNGCGVGSVGLLGVALLLSGLWFRKRS